MVTRHRDPTDRRRVVIGLTELGQRVIAQSDILHPNDPVYKSMVAMGEEQSEQLMLLLRKLIQHMPEGEAIYESICNRMRVSQMK
jgi:DNA-binding MarR family transcriptional regulator